MLQKNNSNSKPLNLVDFILSGKKYSEVLPPDMVVAVLESKCNLKCSHCYYNHAIICENLINNWSKQIDQIVNWRAEVSYAGRILTKPAAMFIGEYYKKSKKKIGIVDNGYTILKYPELLPIYKYINISLDGIPVDHDRQRNLKGSFDVAWETVMALKKKSIEQDNKYIYPIISSVFSPLNINEWGEFEKILIEENIPMSCTPVSGVKENNNRDMPLFDAEKLVKAFHVVVGGMPKLINLYDPEHMEALLPYLKSYHWTITKKEDGIETKIMKGKNNYTKIVYRPPSIQVFREKVLLWNGDFYAVVDAANSNFNDKATDKHLLEISNRFLTDERRYIRELLSTVK